MSFRVIATAFPGRPLDTSHEAEALTPLGVTIDHAAVGDEDAYIEAVKDADAIIVGGQEVNARVINALEKTKIIANAGIGFDRVDVDAATARGIVVTNVPDVFVHEVANHAMMLLLNLAKKTLQLDRCVREGRWLEARTYLSPMPKVTDNVLGLVAFGNIPRAVAQRARGFEMRVIAWDPFVPQEIFAQHHVERVESLQDLFRRADFVSAHLPLTDKTRGLLDWSCFSAMKPTGYFINTGRGRTHNEADLIRALREKQIAGAGLDVMEQEPTSPDNPLHSMENVVLTPHTASISDVANVERRRRVGEEIAAVLQGRRPRNVVNKAVLDRVSLREQVPT